MIEFEALRDSSAHEVETNPVSDRNGLGSVVKNRILGVIFAFREWRSLQRELREFPDQIEICQEKILEALTDYRLTFAQVDHQPEQVDDEVWVRFEQIESIIPILKQQTFRRALFLRSRSRLLKYWRSWQELISDQEQYLEYLAEAPGKLESYDRMQTTLELRRIESLQEEENSRSVEVARKLLEQSIREIEQRGHSSDEITNGSKILNFEEARSFWYESFEQILQIDRLDKPNTDKVLSNLRWLGEVVRDTPVLARGVRAVEDKYSQLISAHEMLVKFGDSVIPQSEIARTSAMVNDEIPQLWAKGDFDKLDRQIQSLHNFIEYYELKVQTELALAERRRPGLTQALTMQLENEKNGYHGLISLSRSLVTAVDARDRFMKGHSERVTQITVEIAKKMSWQQSELEQLELAALLHDVGKLSIPESILTKVGPLTPNEWTVIQMHPVYGAEIIKPIAPLKGIIPWVYHHQERWDGKGYPDQLSKRDIPPASSIIALSEAYTVMTTDLPQRAAMPEIEVIETIKQEMGKQFNPDVVEAYLEVMEDRS